MATISPDMPVASTTVASILAVADAAAAARDARLNTIVYIGDSLTAHGGGIPANPFYKPWGFWTWAQDLSGNRLKVLSNAGIGGNTAANVLARIQADVVALAPGYCHVLAGINDSGVTSFASVTASMTAIFDALQNVGIIPIVGTIPPRASYTTTQRADGEALNNWLRAQGRNRRGLTVVDYAAVLTNPVDGTYLSGMAQADGIHTAIPGAYAMGRQLAAALSQLVPASSVLSVSEGDALNLVAKGRFVAGGAGAVPTGWVEGGTGTSTYSKVARTDGVSGNWQQVVVSTGGSRYLQSTNMAIGAGLAIGDTIQGLVEYDIYNLDQAPAANTVGFQMKVQCYDGAGFPAAGQTTDLYWDATYENTVPNPRAGVFCTPPLIIPAATTLLQMVISMAGGGTYKLDRATVRKVI